MSTRGKPRQLNVSSVKVGIMGELFERGFRKMLAAGRSMDLQFFRYITGLLIRHAVAVGLLALEQLRLLLSD